MHSASDDSLTAIYSTTATKLRAGNLRATEAAGRRISL
jgi:hypothetical protein